jgi:DNA-binding transcriptional regulator PaaX
VRKKVSRTLQILTSVEDILLIFDDYFSMDRRKGIELDDWLSVGTRKTTYYFVKKGVLNPDLTFKEKPKSVLKLIKNPWDGLWRFVVFDIPEKKSNYRDIIRRRLEYLGFKQLQRSVWFSPLPLRTLVKKIDKQIDDYDYLTVIEGKIYRDDPKNIVKDKWNIQVWKQDTLNWIGSVKNLGKIDRELHDKFWDLILDHPKVPLDLLPLSWPFEKMIKTFGSYKFLK